jgi:hypothetical protein
MMSPSQYQDYLNRLDVASAQWQKQVNSVNMEKLSIDYATGKMMERARHAILGNLDLLRGFVKEQRSIDRLSVDVGIEEVIGDAFDPVSTLLSILPTNQQGSTLQQSLSSIQTEMSDLQLEIRQHTVAYADKLQTKAEGCTK